LELIFHHWIELVQWVLDNDGDNFHDHHSFQFCPIGLWSILIGPLYYDKHSDVFDQTYNHSRCSKFGELCPWPVVSNCNRKEHHFDNSAEMRRC
jgi:hypothetical protein